MHSDFKELLSTLNGHRVKYLIVGAYAVSIYAQPRATKDLDILVKADAENARARACRGRCSHSNPCVEFEATWQRRVEDAIDEATGLRAGFISRDDLIAANPLRRTAADRTIKPTADEVSRYPRPG